eukprot:g15325.t1
MSLLFLAAISPASELVKRFTTARLLPVHRWYASIALLVSLELKLLEARPSNNLSVNLRPTPVGTLILQAHSLSKLC